MYTYTISFLSQNGTSVEHLSYYMKATPYIFGCGDLGAHRDFLPSTVFQSNPQFTCLFLILLQIYLSVLDPATSRLLCLQLLSHLPHNYLHYSAEPVKLLTPDLHYSAKTLLSHLPQIYIILQNLLRHLPPILHYFAEPVKPLTPGLHYSAEQTGFHSQPLAAQQPVTALSPQ